MTTPEPAPADGPLDQGMPQERTLLSWRRTALTLAIAGFALARLALNASPILAGVMTAIALSVVLIVIINSMRRYRDGDPVETGGKTAAMLSVTTFSLALVEIALIIQE